MMRNKKTILIILMCVLLTGCGQKAKPVADPSAGKALFEQANINSAPGCKTCHSTEPGKIIVGPSLHGIASRAASRVPGQTAEDYLRNCILNPNDYVVDGFAPGMMYPKYKAVLTNSQIDNLIAYLSTLK